MSTPARLLFGLLVFAACVPGKDTTTEVTYEIVTRTSTVAVGSTDCPNGGVKVELGLDDGGADAITRDGSLQDSEVDKTELICNQPPPPTFVTLTQLSMLATGDASCPFGGTKIEYGLDNGDGGSVANNGTLETGEIDGNTNACLAAPPAPDDVLVDTAPIFAGDLICPFGGERVRSGLDDGKPTGTAGNGVLEDGELDVDETRCVASPADEFTAPTGVTGTAFIDVSGGASVGPTGTTGGSAGAIKLLAYGGPLATSVEARKAGTVTAPAAPAAPAFVAGANPVIISTTRPLPTIYNGAIAPTGPYFFCAPGSLEFNCPLYNDAAKATSLHISPGVIVSIGSTGDLRARVEGDLWNEGTVVLQSNVRFSLETHHFINDTNAVFDLRAAPSRSFHVWAVFGGSGSAYNFGTIDTSGLNLSGTGSPTPAASAPISLVASNDLVNGGSLLAKGDLADASTVATAGSDVTLRTLKGNVYNSGEINTRGGDGNGGGAGGGITLYNGDDLSGGEHHPILDDASAYGPGSFSGSGSLISGGGASSGPSAAGDGGAVKIRMVGGSITSSCRIDTRGGDGVNLNRTRGGNGGDVFIGAFTRGSGPLVPAGIFLGPPSVATAPNQGSIDSRGGAAMGIDTSGGNGGDVELFLDVTSSSVVSQAFAIDLLAASTVKPKIELLGYGGNLVARGGVGERASSTGGVITLANSGCPPAPSRKCAVPAARSRLIRSDCTLDVSGGGAITISTDSAVVGPALIEIAGLLDASGAATDTTCNGGQISVRSSAGQTDIDAELRASGGTGPTANGHGGDISIVALIVNLRDRLFARGGVQPRFAGNSGSITVSGYRVTNTSSGTLDNSGHVSAGRITLSGTADLDNAGTIAANGVGPDAPSGPTGTAGGRVELLGGRVRNTSLVSATGASLPGAAGGTGGTISVFGTSLSQTACFDVRGGAGVSTGALGTIEPAGTPNMCP